MERDRLALIVAVTGSTISGVIALLIIGGVLWSALTLGRVPEPLSNWGGVIIGFFFGQFFGFVQSVFSKHALEKPEGN